MRFHEARETPLVAYAGYPAIVMFNGPFINRLRRTFICADLTLGTIAVYPLMRIGIVVDRQNLYIGEYRREPHPRPVFRRNNEPAYPKLAKPCRLRERRVQRHAHQRMPGMGGVSHFTQIFGALDYGKSLIAVDFVNRLSGCRRGSGGDANPVHHHGGSQAGGIELSALQGFLHNVKPDRRIFSALVPYSLELNEIVANCTVG